MASAPQEKLTRNAFRILGLTAGASQMQVDSAARMMRLYNDPAQIPPTPNDLRYLGPLPRTSVVIEDAAARLAHPESRIQERLWWFFTPPPETKQFPKPVPGAPIDSFHACLLTHFMRLVHIRTENAVLDQWKSLLDDFTRLANSQQFKFLLLSAESDGDFEKRAAETEIASALAALPEQAAAILVNSADHALDRKNLSLARDILALVSSLEACPRARKSLLERMEDQLVSGCRRSSLEIENAWKIMRIEPLKKAVGIAEFGCKYTHEPLMRVLLQNASSEDADAADRIKAPVVELLAYIAKACDGCYDYVAAESHLLRAIAVADKSPMRATLQNRLESTRPQAEAQRKKVAPRIVAKTPAFGAKGCATVVGVVAVTILLAVLCAVFLPNPEQDGDFIPPPRHSYFPDSHGYSDALKALDEYQKKHPNHKTAPEIISPTTSSLTVFNLPPPHPVDVPGESQLPTASPDTKFRINP